MSSQNETLTKTRTVLAANAQMSARLFNIGNLLSVLPGLIVAPFILLTDPKQTAMIFMFIAMIVPPILWFGLSIVIYIMARHHPNTLVGHYTQQAAYRYYGMIGIVIPVGSFFGTDWKLWIITGGVVALVIVPWTIWDLIKIQQHDWQDTQITTEETTGETV